MNLAERLSAELPVLWEAFDGCEIEVDDRLLVIPSYQINGGWSRTETPILVEIPIGYPTTPPDNFCVAADLRLAGGSTPSNTMGVRTIGGRPWLQFSYHIELSDWRPHSDISKSDTLVTFLIGALTRLEEAN